MNKFWKIFKHEYTRHVLRKRFIFALLSVPLWIVFSIGMGLVSVFLSTNRTPVGYVDPGQVIIAPLPPEERSSMFEVKFHAYASESEARAALDAKKIQAYFILPVDYRQTLDAHVYYLEQPDSTVYNQFSSLLRYNLLAEQSPEITRRVLNGPEVVLQSTQENRQASNSDWLKIVAPLAAGIFLMISVFTSSGYLMSSVVEEKENRTMELLATSASPGQIMGAKISALISVGLTQVLVWSVFPLVVIALAAAYTPFLKGVNLEWQPIALVFLTAIPTFVLVASLMATIGASITESSEGQQVSGLVMMPVMAPVMLIGVLVGNPSGVIAMFLSFFPLTASLGLLIRMAFSTVPTWQIIVSTAILIVSAAGALWLAGRVFRFGMLRYGKRMGWKDVFQSVRPDRAPAAPDKELA